MVIFYTIVLFLICCAVIVEAILLTLNVIGLFRAKGVPFVPLSKKAIAEVINASNFQPDDLIVDLGCGDGRVLFGFEKAGAANLLGYEINHWPYILGIVKKYFRKSKAELRCQNFFHAKLGDVKIIVCYLLPKTLTALREKFDAELKPGSRIVSFGFEIKDWRLPQIIQTDKEKNAKQNVFVYQI
ncbi:MAG: class I SAM-dependent methyltransferase [Candidatus Falkowbacteria bacterium]